ncbi:MAG: general secretion pathway protein GspE [Myxococcaceae bacterium]|jgi:hypothetical protein|nr:general secretion pathway protein GspE [Myxococcaceae bacterium]
MGNRAPTRLRDIIIASGLIDELQLRSATGRIEQWGGRLPAMLVELGFVYEAALTEAIGKALGMPVTHLGPVRRNPAVLARLDVDFAEEHAVFPVQVHGRSLLLAMADPTDLSLVDAVAARVGLRIVPQLAPESEIMHAIATHYRGLEAHPRAQSRLVRQPERAPTDLAPTRTPRAPPSDQAPATPPQVPAPAAPAWSTSTQPADPFDLTASAFSQEELRLLDACRLNQEKASAVVRALTELLTEKGYLG